MCEKAKVIYVSKGPLPCMGVELFLRVKGRLPDKENDKVDKALAKEYLDMWFAKKLSKYDRNTQSYAYHVYGGGNI